MIKLFIWNDFRAFLPCFSAKLLMLFCVTLCLLLVMAQPIICVFPQLLRNDLIFQTRLFQLQFMMELFKHGQGVNL